jgi:hypothetical protein|eukprot:COSAG01_NODE_9333_length_2481_cov_2.599076_2_plen_155_part_00
MGNTCCVDGGSAPYAASSFTRGSSFYNDATPASRTSSRWGGGGLPLPPEQATAQAGVAVGRGQRTGGGTPSPPPCDGRLTVAVLSLSELALMGPRGGGTVYATVRRSRSTRSLSEHTFLAPPSLAAGTPAERNRLAHACARRLLVDNALRVWPR